MDEACRKRVVWVSAPAGSGKTTLVAGYLQERGLRHLWYQMDERDADPAAFFYFLRLAAGNLAPRKHEPLPLLTPEYLLGVPVFSRNFFEHLYVRFKTPCVIVFDNFQDLPEDAILQDLLAESLEVVPEGINVIFISRTAPAPRLARIRSRQNLALLAEPDLRLSPEEIAGIAAMHVTGQLPESFLVGLHRATDGWAAGVTLMLEASPELSPLDLPTTEHSVIFDYFATEIFQRAEPELREFMLATALLPQFSAGAAQSLTGNTSADRILRELARRNYFTMELQGTKTSYQYHPLFRRYLLEQARLEYSKAQLQALRKKGATVLLQEEDRENAVPLLLATLSWRDLDKVIQQIGSELMAQGRHLTLSDWLQAIPAAHQEEHPWLLYWLATGQLLTDPDASRGNYIRALELFAAREIISGTFLAWAGIVDTVVNQLADVKQFDRLLETFGTLREKYADRLPEELIMQLAPRVFAAMTLRQPWHPDLPSWRDKVTTLFESGADPSLRILSGFYLLTSSLWSGNREGAAHILEVQNAIGAAKNASPLTRITGKLGMAWYGWATGDHGACQQAVEEGLALAHQSGVHVWTYILMIESCVSALITGNLHQADPLLQGVASFLDAARPMDRLYYYHNRAWQGLLENDTTKALANQSRALEIAQELGAVYVEAEARYGMFHVCHARGDLVAAHTHLEEARRLGELFGGSTMAFQCDMGEAQELLDQGRLRDGLTALRSGLNRITEKGHVAFSWWRRDVMSRLCATALLHSIEPESARRIIRQHGLLPEPSMNTMESWPWPVKLKVLGGFAVEVDGAPLTFSGKAQKKPLEMLQAIIAFGGENVRDEQITEALWPDSDGDLSMQSYRTTLSRLRRLLRYENAITTGSGRVGLDRRLVWADLWALDHAARAESHTGEAGETAGQPPNRLLTMIERHAGEFLPGCEEPWVLPMRERIRNTCLQAIMEAGNRLEERGETEKAIKHYLKGLELDRLVEALYQRLITCYGTLGQGAEALRIFNRCRRTFAEELGIEPSATTMAILKRHVALTE